MAAIYESSSCRARTWASGAAIETIVTGRMDKGLALFMAAACTEIIAKRGSVVGCHDWFGAPDYDPDYRKVWTDWLLKYRKSVTAIHVLTTSRFVRMGLNVADLAIGGGLFGTGMLHVYSARSEYEVARNKAMGARPELGT